MLTETEIPGRNPAARSLSDKALLSSQNSVPNFELLRLCNKERGEETEDDAAVVDYVEEQLDVEEPERNVAETPVKIVIRGRRTRDRGATSAHFGPFPDFACLFMHT